MFVSDSTLNFMGTKLQLISTEGFSWEVSVDPSATVESMKKLALQYFYPSELSASPEQFRVIYPAQSRALLEHHALHEEHIKDNEVLLFVRRRVASSAASASANMHNTYTRNPSSAPNTDSELKPPTAAEIHAATRDVQVPPKPQSPSSSPNAAGAQHNHHYPFALHDESDSNVDFQLELRKIVISLISVMATLMHGNQDSELICKEMHTRIKHRLKNSSSHPVEGTKFQFPPPPEVECHPMGIVAGLLEAKKREFRPNPKAVEALKAMGHKDEQIIQALRANKNSKDAASEWLVAGKATSLAQADDITGLDPNGHLFTALVSAPTVRLGLNNAKTLLAFLNILESPSSANIWLNDTDTAPVLSAIFKIYHAEKHAEPSGADILG